MGVRAKFSSEESTCANRSLSTMVLQAAQFHSLIPVPTVTIKSISFARASLADACPATPNTAPVSSTSCMIVSTVPTATADDEHDPLRGT